MADFLIFGRKNEGDVVEVYCTNLKNDGNTWAAVKTVSGHVHLKWVTVDGDSFLSFDPRIDEWHPGEVVTN